MLRRTGLWVAWLPAVLGCGDAAGVNGRDAAADAPGNYGRDGGSCGDGHLDRGEDCDGSVLGQSCESLGLVRGPLSCSSECTIDTSLCGTNPREDPPRFFSAEDMALACDQIISCGVVPLPTPEERLAIGLPSSQQEFCAMRLVHECLECTLAETEPGSDPDGGFTACENDCRVECIDQSFPHADGLLDPDRCVANAADFVSHFDAACLCANCSVLMADCVMTTFCYAALICIDEAGCQDAACSAAGACADPIQAVLNDLLTQPRFLELQACIVDNGCQEP